MGRANSLRTKLILIMLLLILALMSVVGVFLTSGLSKFYISRFYDQMETVFSQDFLLQLEEVAKSEESPETALCELLMAQSDLGIDVSNRNVYVLDKSGKVLASSENDTELPLAVTPNMLTAIGGEVGETSSASAEYMDVAVPVGNYIVYILDNKATVNDLTDEMLGIIIEALALGVAISIVLAVLLSQILITPIRALTDGTLHVAAGDFSQKLEVPSHDEIGTLTQNFNRMALVLQNTLAEVENERTKLSTLFLHMTDGVTAFGPNGKIIHYNPAATQMLGMRLDPSVNFQELYGKEAEFDTVTTLKRPNFLEREKTVGRRELSLFMAPFAAEQGQSGVLVVIHDVTEQKKTEQMQRDFVANVSHELKTPLTNVKSYAETIIGSGDELPTELRSHFLGVIVSEADRMTRIVKDLLNLSKLDSGRMEITSTEFSLAKALRNVWEGEKMDAKNHNHTFLCQLPEEDALTVCGDPERIEQVLLNITSNAIKYTPDGGKITVSAQRQKRNIVVTVADNGIGIPEKDLPHLFERFYRVDKARSRSSGGTGLGLSIARELIKLHNGDIRIESTYGEGTTVYITLPAANP